MIAAIDRHARDDFPREACGVLLARDGRIVEAVPASNVAAHPERQFEIDPAVLLASHRDARAAGAQIAGWYHSHPDGPAEPSRIDAARAVEDGKIWLVAAGDAVTAWRAVAGGALHGRFEAVAYEVT